MKLDLDAKSRTGFDRIGTSDVLQHILVPKFLAKITAYESSYQDRVMSSTGFFVKQSRVFLVYLSPFT